MESFPPPARARLRPRRRGGRGPQPGPWMTHCHHVHHSESGMMTRHRLPDPGPEPARQARKQAGPRTSRQKDD
ncbi:multicopper oxidase domain-containing protein [Streptomyces sp. NPDC002587]